MRACDGGMMVVDALVLHDSDCYVEEGITNSPHKGREGREREKGGHSASQPATPGPGAGWGRDWDWQKVIKQSRWGGGFCQTAASPAPPAAPLVVVGLAVVLAVVLLSFRIDSFPSLPFPSFVCVATVRLPRYIQVSFSPSLPWDSFYSSASRLTLCTLAQKWLFVKFSTFNFFELGNQDHAQLSCDMKM
ncbi:uncharacterized protein [Physcomitrium patens]|uniref:uncharacterized protein n=1 Tax=Physcomitrium patens TaxID=3218 RepID=UPI003CCD2B55